MEITLHLGAHRCASTSFQFYMRDHVDALSREGLSFWGPLRTRRQIFEGLFPRADAPAPQKMQRRAVGRVRLSAAQARAEGAAHLLVSDENMIGTTRQSIRARKLYPAIGERMARISDAFDGQITRLVLCIRAQDMWWASALAYAVGRGHNVPTASALQQIATAPRSWQDVITDLACAVPTAQIVVLPFETLMGRPAQVLGAATGMHPPKDTQNRWLNKAPDLARLRHLLAERGSDPDAVPRGSGRWQPFNATQLAQLNERYLDDLFWLESGADGLASYKEYTTAQGSGPSLTAEDFTRGHGHDTQGHDQEDRHRRMAGTRSG